MKGHYARRVRSLLALEMGEVILRLFLGGLNENESFLVTHRALSKFGVSVRSCPEVYGVDRGVTLLFIKRFESDGETECRNRDIPV
jgi:hypothetical protein